MIAHFMANNQNNNNEPNNNPPPLPQIDMLSRFHRFRNKKFSGAAEPMIAKIIGSTLPTTRVAPIVKS
jgi:hypothetical protein